MVKSNRRTVIILILTCIGMFGFGFALVPLYRVFCEVAGINGKTSSMADTSTAGRVDMTRTIVVQFVVSKNETLPWVFYPETKEIRIHPGEVIKINYYAKNNSAQTMTVQAVPSVTPGLAAKHLKKTECFCFTQQVLKAGESRDMPVLFHLDDQLPRDINTVTLSYTLYNVAQPTAAQTVSDNATGTTTPGSKFKTR